MAQEKQSNEMMREFGKWLLDIAKYVLTAVVIASIFRSLDDPIWVYILGIVIVALFLLLGLILIKKSTVKKRK